MATSMPSSTPELANHASSRYRQPNGGLFLGLLHEPIGSRRAMVLGRPADDHDVKVAGTLVGHVNVLTIRLVTLTTSYGLFLYNHRT